MWKGFAYKVKCLIDPVRSATVQFSLFPAAYPFSTKLMEYFEEESAKKVHTAAVCVYPSRVMDAHDKLRRLNKLDEINIAAGNFSISIHFTLL